MNGTSGTLDVDLRSPRSVLLIEQLGPTLPAPYEVDPTVTSNLAARVRGPSRMKPIRQRHGLNMV
eukprot:8557139-Pyramimonas_sp.AAC.1